MAICSGQLGPHKVRGERRALLLSSVMRPWQGHNSDLSARQGGFKHRWTTPGVRGCLAFAVEFVLLSIIHQAGAPRRMSGTAMHSASLEVLMSVVLADVSGSYIGQGNSGTAWLSSFCQLWLQPMSLPARWGKCAPNVQYDTIWQCSTSGSCWSL